MSTPDPRIETIFHATLERAPAEREVFVSAATKGDESLLRGVQRLLAAHEEAENYFEPPNTPEIEAELDRLRPEQAGEVIGSYTLIEEIGEGGFGRVWIAEQKVPVRRRVALKILKLGMDTKEVLARFEQERQALALMDHPSIAKVFDAGATRHGRPFIVMELVDGVKITEYCDAQNLSMRERLELFMAVCQAVQHAHQKGVIHRDLKPSNVLVTLQDGIPVPKVIDFGVAKAVEQRLSDLTVHTLIEQMIGTPPYMSPEQAEMSALNVDTRTDIYALGVLLYELLTGRTPFDAATLMKASYEEMRRIIREEEPPKPSTALHTMAPNVLTEVAQHRQSEPPKLIHTVRGDLDWIVMKALEKDRARRYETANGFARDVQRHLRCEPVVARPPSRRYRFGRLVRRNRLVFVATGAVAAALIIGLSVAMNSLFNERKARAGEAEQRKLAEERGRQAAANELRARRFLYAADMNLAQEALRVNNLGRARRLLDQHRPKPGEQDLRGWEWRYLWQQCRSEATATLTKHTARVLSVSFSADSKLLAVAFLDRRLEIWDVPSRTLFRSLQTEGELGSIRFGPLGYLLAQQTRTGVTLNDLASSDAPVTVEVGAVVQAFSFTHNGSLLICRVVEQGSTVGGSSARVPAFRVIDLARREVVTSSLPSEFTAFQPAGLARFSPDSTRYYDAGYRLGRALTVGVFRHSDSGFEHEFVVGADDKLSAMDLAPDGKILATSTGWEDFTIRVWDAVNLKQVTQLDRHTAWIAELTFSPDGRTLASASGDQTIRLWDTQTWQERAVLRGHGGEVWAVAFSPDGKWLASGAKDGEVLLWSSEAPPTVRGRFDFPSDVGRVVKIPSEPWILTQSTNGSRSIWSLPSLTETELPKDFSETLPRLGVNRGQTTSRDGRFEAWSSEAGLVRLLDRSLNRDLILQGHLLAVDGVAFSPDGSRLVTTSGGREAGKIWDTETGQELLNLAGRGMNLYSATFSEDGDVLIAGAPYALGYWQVWRAPSREEIESAERTAGRWPPTEVFAPPPPPLTQPELKDLVERAQRKIPASLLETARRVLSLEETLKLISRVSAANPQNSGISLQAAVLQVWFAKNIDHVTTCQRTLKQAVDTEIADTAEHAAKSFFLRPSSDPEMLAAALALARKAVALGHGSAALPWYQMTLGMAEYRHGNYQAAEEALTSAEHAGPETFSVSHVHGTAGFFHAMSLFQQGKEDEARQCFVKTKSTMKPLPADGKTLMSNEADSNDLILWLAFKEAKDLLQPDTPPKPAAK